MGSRLSGTVRVLLKRGQHPVTKDLQAILWHGRTRHLQVPQGAKITKVQFTLDSGFGPDTGQWTCAAEASARETPRQLTGRRDVVRLAGPAYRRIGCQ
jgi:hypothetical protein